MPTREVRKPTCCIFHTSLIDIPRHPQELALVESGLTLYSSRPWPKDRLGPECITTFRNQKKTSREKEACLDDLFLHVLKAAILHQLLQLRG